MKHIAIIILILSIILIGCTATPEASPTSTQKPTDDIEPTIEVTSTATSKSIKEDASSYKIFEFEGSKRYYLIFTPESYTGTENLPLVLHISSYGWTPKQEMEYTKLNQVADSNNFIIVYPSSVNNWNSGIGENPQWPTGDSNDVGFIDTFIDFLDSNYRIDLDRIYVTGYSNGGFMAYKLACQLSHRIAAIASVGGEISTNTLADCNPLRTMPILQIHGTEDSWISINGATGLESVEETLNFWIQYNDCQDTNTIAIEDIDTTDDSTVEKISYSNCTDNSNIIFFKVINGGHTWPGAGPAGYPAGNTNQDINAGIEIWNFFEQYSLSAVGE